MTREELENSLEFFPENKIIKSHLEANKKIEQLEKAIRLVKHFFLLMNEDSPSEQIRETAVACNKAFAELEEER